MRLYCYVRCMQVREGSAMKHYNGPYSSSRSPHNALHSPSIYSIVPFRSPYTIERLYDCICPYSVGMGEFIC